MFGIGSLRLENLAQLIREVCFEVPRPAFGFYLG
jgi:hypothetical protein